MSAKTWPSKLQKSLDQVAEVLPGDQKRHLAFARGDGEPQESKATGL